MRGRASVLARAARVEAELARRPPRRDSPWNLDALSDADLEALLPLAEKQAGAEGREPAWSAAELSLMEQLWAKQAGAAP